MKLEVKQVIGEQKKCFKKEILFSLTGFVIFILFIIFLLPDDQKLFAITSITILIAIMLYRNIKPLIYFSNFLKHPYMMDLQKSLNNTIFYSKENYIITEDCIIQLDRKIVLINYYNIILIYKYRNRKWGRTILRIILRDNSYYDFLIVLDDSYRFQTDVCDFSNIILQKNPNVLVGNTEENRKILLEKYGIKI